MTPTVSRQIRKIPVTTENLRPWVAEELNPLLTQIRQGMNYIARQQASQVSDASGTMQTIWTSDDIAVNTAVRFDANVIGYEGGNFSTFTVVYGFYNNGILTPNSNATVVSINSAGYAVQFIAVGNHVEFQIQDAGNPAQFTAVIDALVVVGP